LLEEARSVTGPTLKNSVGKPGGWKCIEVSACLWLSYPF
jgi:hypothetical protein